MDGRYDAFLCHAKTQLTHGRSTPELSNFRAPFRFTFCSVYDTSKSFNNYLAQQGLDTTLKRLKLKRKQKHSVVPHVSRHISEMTIYV